jgi:hypothetical protein
MVARTREQEQRRYSWVQRLAMLVLVSLFLAFLLLLGTAQDISARNHSATSALLRSAPQDTITPSLPTDTPVLNTPTEVPTSTATVPAAATPTAVVGGTDTPVVANTPADSGGGAADPGPTGPQATKVVLSQPTVSNGSGGPLGGLSPSNFGTNGLLVATTLGCVVALLGIAIGGIALYVLVQGGYGPFLRALAQGNRRGKDRTGRWRDPSKSGRSSYNDDYVRDLSPPNPRRTRLGEYSSGSGDRSRRW